MASILGHVGAWAPRAEQVATARLLREDGEIDAYQAAMGEGVRARLDALYAGLVGLREQGFPVDAIVPMGAIYLTARFPLHGRRGPGGELRTNEDVRRWLLEAAGLAAVPFQAFGMKEESGWFRLSAGAVSLPEIEAMFGRLRAALQALDADVPASGREAVRAER
jgi:aspartate aminotransferase